MPRLTITDQKLTVWGFTIAYSALMLSLIMLTMPMAANWRGPVCLYVLLPFGLIGAGMLLYAHFYEWQIGNDGPADVA